jgi:hypothetical protein
LLLISLFSCISLTAMGRCHRAELSWAFSP